MGLALFWVQFYSGVQLHGGICARTREDNPAKRCCPQTGLKVLSVRRAGKILLMPGQSARRLKAEKPMSLQAVATAAHELKSPAEAMTYLV